MRQSRGALLALVVVGVFSPGARADDADQIVEKAIAALGGEEKLSKVVAFAWSARGSMKVGGHISEGEFFTTFSGLDKVKRYIASRPPHSMIVDGDKGWHIFKQEYKPMDAEALAMQKRGIYLQVVPTLLVPLKGKGFRFELAGDEEIRGKPASVIKIVGPDGKDFTLAFDKKTFLPVREVAREVGPDGKERVEETFFGAYKDFGGIQKATSVETRTDSQNYGFIDIINFRVLDKVPAGTFAGPP
jgi:hypothetical protein